MRIVFMGTPDFAVEALKELVKVHEVVCVYTREPKESGRGKKINKTPVHLLAEEYGILVKTPRTLKDKNEQDFLKSLNAEVAIVAAYGLLLPQVVLDIFPKGVYNIHASLLPRWRGAAPIQRAIESGDKESGISIMKVVQALDAGDVMLQEKISITSTMTGGELHDALALMGGKLLLSCLERLDDIKPIKQNENLVTYAQKIDKSECLLDFNCSCEQLIAKIHAFSPYPATYFMYKNERFKVFNAQICSHEKKTAGEIIEGANSLKIAVADGVLEILSIQREGKQTQPIQSLLRGFQFEKGIILG